MIKKHLPCQEIIQYFLLKVDRFLFCSTKNLFIPINHFQIRKEGIGFEKDE